jgi:hypothetical protein
MTDWTRLAEAVARGVEEIAMSEVTTIAEFNLRLEALDKVVSDAITEHTPMVKPSPFTKRWWMTDLAVTKKAVQKLARKSYRARHNEDEHIHEEYRKARNDYSAQIRTAKLEHWID